MWQPDWPSLNRGFYALINRFMEEASLLPYDDNQNLDLLNTRRVTMAVATALPTQREQRVCECAHSRVPTQQRPSLSCRSIRPQRRYQFLITHGGDDVQNAENVVLNWVNASGNTIRAVEAVHAILFVATLFMAFRCGLIALWGRRPMPKQLRPLSHSRCHAPC